MMKRIFTERSVTTKAKKNGGVKEENAGLDTITGEYRMFPDAYHE